MNFGLNIDEQEQQQNLPEKHLMGIGSMWQEFKKKGESWEKEAMEIAPETQFGARVETMGCTGYNTNNILEMLFKKQFGIDFNLSDRFVNKMSGTTRNGNTVDAPIDCIRKNGFLFENEWSWNRDTFEWEDYYLSIPTSKVSLAKTRLNDWDFAHEYVPVNNKEAIINALKTSPLGATVYAWQKNDKGLYVDGGNRANHWTVAIIGYEYGKYWLCYDSYPDDFNSGDNPQPVEFLKKLDWNYNFGCIKRYKIIDKRSKKTLSEKIKSMFTKIKRDIHGGLWFVKNGEKQKLHGWLSLAGAIVDEIGCETISDDKLNKMKERAFFG